MFRDYTDMKLFLQLSTDPIEHETRKNTAHSACMVFLYQCFQWFASTHESVYGANNSQANNQAEEQRDLHL
jgi:hypothetical protein